MEQTLILVLGIIAILFVGAALSIGLMLIKKHKQSTQPKKQGKNLNKP